MIRPIHIAFAASVTAVMATAWPASSAYSTGLMTQKQAALQGLVATRKVPEQKVDKLIVRLRTGKSQAQASAMSADRAQGSRARSDLPSRIRSRRGSERRHRAAHRRDGRSAPHGPGLDG